jgi:beta-glucosidase
VTFKVPMSQLAYYDIRSKGFVVEPGAFRLMVGSSSEDIRLRARLNVAAVKK